MVNVQFLTVVNTFFPPCDPHNNSDEGGSWTAECTSCQCNVNSTNPEDAGIGYGCYSLPEAPMQCTCNDSVCSNETCTSAKGTWTTQCMSCTCDEGNESTDDGNGDDGDDSTGWGCYDINVHVCGCAPEFCAEDTCEKAGGIFTDGCGTCRCEEVFSPSNTAPPDTGTTVAPVPAPDDDGATVEPTSVLVTTTSDPTEAPTETRQPARLQKEFGLTGEPCCLTQSKIDGCSP
jgi:hypothetical protein